MLYSHTPPEKGTLFGALSNELSHLFYNMTTEMTFPYLIPSLTLLNGGNI